MITLKDLEDPKLVQEKMKRAEKPKKTSRDLIRKELPHRVDGILIPDEDFIDTDKLRDFPC